MEVNCNAFLGTFFVVYQFKSEYSLLNILGELDDSKLDLTQVFVISTVMNYVFLEDHTGTFTEAKHIRRRVQIVV